MDTKQLKADIDAACVANMSDGHRWHMGASIIGHECERYVWNTFRWLKQEQFEGRMLRLFARGQDEEPRFVKALASVGIQVQELDAATGKQLRISDCNGHFGGSLDGVGWTPPGAVEFLVEFKTHGLKSFDELVKYGVAQAKPQHVVQMQTYAPYYKLTHGLYCAVNKNTDEFHFEWLTLDWNIGALHVAKAERLINSQTPPKKISETPTYFKCKWCHFSGICHSNHIPEKNCRSCAKATPVENGEWACSDILINNIIPRDFVPHGCQNWLSIV